MVERSNNIISLEERIKQKQNESILNKLAKVGRLSNIVTLPIGALVFFSTGNPLLLAGDLASDKVYSEVQKRNNQRIENQERGRAGLMSRKSRLALVSEIKSTSGTKNQPQPLAKAA